LVVLNRGGKSLSPLGGRDPAQCLIQRSAASGVRPSVECFRSTDASAPPAESLLAPKIFFCKNVFRTKATAFIGQNHFCQVFVRGGMTKFSKWKVPLPGGQAPCNKLLVGTTRHCCAPRRLIARSFEMRCTVWSRCRAAWQPLRYPCLSQAAFAPSARSRWRSSAGRASRLSNRRRAPGRGRDCAKRSISCNSCAGPEP